ncbi:hypothetical protein Tco_0380081, partial [Tanacetum coccineum]
MRTGKQQQTADKAADSDKQQQIQTADRTTDSDSGKQNHPDKRGITRQYPMQNQTKSDET